MGSGSGWSKYRQVPSPKRWRRISMVERKFPSSKLPASPARSWAVRTGGVWTKPSSSSRAWRAGQSRAAMRSAIELGIRDERAGAAWREIGSSCDLGEEAPGRRGVAGLEGGGDPGRTARQEGRDLGRDGGAGRQRVGEDGGPLIAFELPWPPGRDEAVRGLDRGPDRVGGRPQVEAAERRVNCRGNGVDRRRETRVGHPPN